MTQLKPGDRVLITNPQLIDFGKAGVIDTYCEIMCERGWRVRLDGDDDSLQYKESSLTPAPDVLTIDRAELPEVVEERGFMVAGGRDFGTFLNAAQHRKTALAQLAVSEFLATREKAEQDAADQHAAILNKRRDELAVELFDQPGYKAHPEPFNYQDATPVVRAAIDRIIQLEGEAKK